MSISDGLQVADILIPIVIVLTSFGYGTIMKRIDKLEEVSHRDDVNMEGRHEKEMDRRIQNVVDLHAKVEKSQGECRRESKELAERIAKIEGRLSK